MENRITNEPRVKCDGNHGGPPCADRECWAREDAQPVGADTLTDAGSFKVWCAEFQKTYGRYPVASDAWHGRAALANRAIPATPAEAPAGHGKVGMHPLDALLPEICQLIDGFKGDAEVLGQWSAWDQSVRDRITAYNLSRLATPLPAQVQPAEQVGEPTKIGTLVTSAEFLAMAKKAGAGSAQQQQPVSAEAIPAEQAAPKGVDYGFCDGVCDD